MWRRFLDWFQGSADAKARAQAQEQALATVLRRGARLLVIAAHRDISRGTGDHYIADADQRTLEDLMPSLVEAFEDYLATLGIEDTALAALWSTLNSSSRADKPTVLQD